MIELGPCSYICYHTTKGFHDFAPTKYWHNFGEEDGIYPRLGYDRSEPDSLSRPGGIHYSGETRRHRELRS